MALPLNEARIIRKETGLRKIKVLVLDKLCDTMTSGKKHQSRAKSWPGMVAYTYILSFLGDRDRRITSSRPAQANFTSSYSQTNFFKKGGLRA
jgi:hypothetical protein